MKLLKNPRFPASSYVLSCHFQDNVEKMPPACAAKLSSDSVSVIKNCDFLKSQIILGAYVFL
jgi:hypothetical protein